MSAPNTPSRPVDAKASTLRKMGSVGTLPSMDQLGLDKSKSLKRTGSVDVNDSPSRNRLGVTRSNSAENAAQAVRGSLESFDLSSLTAQIQLSQSSSSVLSPRNRTVTLGGAEPKPIVKITTKSNTSAHSVIDERTDPYLDVGGFFGMSPGSYASKPVKKKEKEKEDIPSSMLVLNAIIEGVLEFKKKEKGKWKRRWVVLDPNNLFVFKSAEHKGAPIQIPLNLSHPKPPTNKKKAKTQFILQTPTKSYKFQAANETELKEWMKEIRDVCDSLTLQSIGKNEIQGSVNAKEELKKLLEIPGNNICADCAAPNPEWASINLGIFICIECSGIHRNLGTHISKVRSLTLDSWDNEMVRVMKLIGNTKANAVWEAAVPESFKKPSPKDPIGKKGEWIQEKYELGLFKKGQSTEPDFQQEDTHDNHIPEPPPIPELPPTPDEAEDDDDDPLPPYPGSVSSSPKTISPVPSSEATPKVVPTTTTTTPPKPSVPQQQPPVPASTPEDWRTAVAPDGRKYYYNVKTKERTWNVPDALQKVAPSTALPPGWKEAKTPAGKVYYYNKTTKQTVWTRPTK